MKDMTISEIKDYMDSQMKKIGRSNWQEHIDKLHREFNIIIVDHVNLIK